MLPDIAVAVDFLRHWAPGSPWQITAIDPHGMRRIETKTCLGQHLMCGKSAKISISPSTRLKETSAKLARLDRDRTAGVHAERTPTAAAEPAELGHLQNFGILMAELRREIVAAGAELRS